MNIMLVGPQACGKGTQASKLSEKLGLKHFSTGDAFRAEVKSGSELGKKLKETMDAGQLVSNDMVNDVIKNAIEQYKEQGMIFDGYPRTIEQADFLLEQTDLDAVVEIDLSEEESIARISSRYVCPECGKGYNSISQAPQKEGVCDVDGVALIQRDDDKPEAVKKRLADYHTQTEPIIKHYAKKGITVYKIDGKQSIEEVFDAIVKALNI